MTANQWKVTSMPWGYKLVGMSLLLRGWKIWYWEIVSRLYRRVTNRMRSVDITHAILSIDLNACIVTVNFVMQATVDRTKITLSLSCTKPTEHYHFWFSEFLNMSQGCTGINWKHWTFITMEASWIVKAKKNVTSAKSNGCVF